MEERIDPEAAWAIIREESHTVGFDAAARTAVGESPHADFFRRWLDRKHQASMGWLERSAETRCDPRDRFPWARSICTFALSHHHEEGGSSGRVARYAWSRNYHKVISGMLKELVGRLKERLPLTRGRYYVDTGPILERDWAWASGLGWFGKNTNLLRTDLGSFFFIGVLLLPFDLGSGTPHPDRCGTCTACLDACPTDALPEPYRLDARACISYWTIEHRGSLPTDVRTELSGYLFGCDICQDVCPWTRKARRAGPRLDRRPAVADVEPEEVLPLDREAFLDRFAGTPVMRAKREGLLRNAAYLLGTEGDATAVPLLADRLRREENPVVRSAIAWALGRLGDSPARETLEERLQMEDNPSVRDEIEASLERLSARSERKGEGNGE